MNSLISRLKTPSAQVVLRLCAILFIALIAFAAVQREQRNYPAFSPLDEAAHFDYAVELAHGTVPAWGSRLDQETLLVSSCLRPAAEGSVADCVVRQRDPRTAGAEGYSYEAQQPPLGYLPYAVGYLLARGDTPAATLDTVRDVGGTFWLVCAVVLLTILSFQLALGFLRTFVLAGVVLLAPMTVLSFATISNDGSTLATSLLFCVAFLASRRWGGRASVAVGVVAGILLGAAKAYTLVLPASVIGVIVVSEWLRHGRRTRVLKSLWAQSRVRYCLASLVGAGVAVGGFSLIQTLRAQVPASRVLDALLAVAPHTHFIQLKTVVLSISGLGNAWMGGSNGLVLSNWDVFYLANAVFLLVLGFAMAKNRSVRGIESSRFFAAAWVVGVVALGIAWPTLLFVQGHWDSYAQNRYGLIFFPFAIIAIAAALERRGSMGERGAETGGEKPILRSS